MVDPYERILLKRLDLLREQHLLLSDKYREYNKLYLSELRKLSLVNNTFNDMVVGSGLLDEVVEEVDEVDEVIVEEPVIEENLSEEGDVGGEEQVMCKKLYKLLVKRTHPDKNGDIYLNNIYKKSKRLYEDRDVLGLLILCSEVEQEHDVPFPNEDIEGETVRLMNEMGFMNSSPVMKWAVLNEDERTEFMIKRMVQMTRTDMSPLSSSS
jgi:hypothetical protein